MLQTSTQGDKAWFLTYSNDQSVVIGRNQDAEAELSHRTDDNKLPWYRRTSGGGAVYHDAGNLNWSFVLDGSLEDRPLLLSAVLEALRPLGLEVHADERGTLFSGHYKIGGTASSLTRGRLLFHGTLLVHSDLNQLKRCLAAHQPGYPQSRAASTGHSVLVRSRPSETANLSGLKPGLKTADIISLLHSGIHRILDGRPSAGRTTTIGGSEAAQLPGLPSKKAIIEYSNIFLSTQWKESRRLPELPSAAAPLSAPGPSAAALLTHRKGFL